MCLIKVCCGRLKKYLNNALYTVPLLSIFVFIILLDETAACTRCGNFILDQAAKLPG